ncbi:MAG: hypothetical protein ACRBF0_17405 [Calditrichia bacterium]
MSRDKSVLFIAANPIGKGDPHFDVEYDRINQQLDSRLNSNPYSLRPPILSVNMQKLQNEMNRQLPYILHFSGHGDFEQGLFFMDTERIANPISADKFTELIDIIDANGNICCIVLNACWTDPTAKILIDHVPYVIGSDRRLENEVAIAFSEGFYNALAAGKDIENACQLGKKAVKNIELSGSEKINIIKNDELLKTFKQREATMAKENEQNNKTDGQEVGQSITNNRNISVGGNVSGSVLITGDKNTVTHSSHNNTAPPAAGSLEEAKLCLKEIKDILAKMQLSQANTIKTKKALETANEFIELENPLRSEIDEEIATAINLIREEDAFESYKAELRSPIEKLKNWLGDNWMHLATVVGALK